MKKFLIIVFMILLLFQPNTKAVTINDIMDDDFKSNINKSNEILNEYAIENIDGQSLIEDLNNGNLNFEYKGFIDNIKQKLRDEFKALFSFASYIIAIVLLVSLINNIQISNGFKKINRLVSLSFFTIAIIAIFEDVSDYACNVIDNLSLFISSLIPVMIGLLSTSGRVVTAGIFNPIMLGVSSFVSVLVRSLILPLSFVGLALKITAEITNRENLSVFGNQIFKIIKWIVGLFMAVYVGIISIIGVTTPRVDDVTLKTAKYAVSNFIPYVGGMLSDSVDLIFTCSNVVKNSVGIYGLLGIISVVIIPCIQIGIKSLMLNLVNGIISSVSEKYIINILNDVIECLNIILGMMFLVSVMYILSISVIMFVGGA